jgi:hypothetical protein
LIAYLNGNERSSSVATFVFDECVKPGRNEAYVSMVTVMEVLVQPLRRGPGPFRTVLNFLTRFSHLTPLEIDVGVAHQAANLRAFGGFKPSDALTIASGFMAGVGHLVTNDDRWLKLANFPDQRISICYLERHLPFP